MEILAELRQEHEHLQEAILVLERLASGQGKRRGRPPAWMATPRPEPTDATTERKRKPFSAATKRKMAASQKRRWAELRKAEAKG